MQPLHLQKNGCLSHGTIVHELLHALGFEHEQRRPDRDDHVNIIFENIEPVYFPQFEKVNSEQFSGYDTPYDYDSVMHYDGKMFSINGNDTMVPKKEGVQLIYVQEMSQDDVNALLKAYKC